MLEGKASLLSRPLYLQLREELVKRISGGEFKCGMTLPNEIRLADQFGVSIGTVRKALGLMEQEHLITRHQGRGTTVNDISTKSFSAIEGLDGQRIVGDKRPKRVRQYKAENIEANKLRLTVGTEIISVERIRYNLGSPFLSENAIIPASLFQNLPENLGDYSLASLALANGYIASYAEETIAPALASEDDAEDLKVTTGTPLIALDRVIFSDLGVPLQWRTAKCFLRNERLTVRYR